MNLANFTVRRIALAAKNEFRSAVGSFTTREVLIVEATDEAGNVGWGECSAFPRPGYGSEYLDGAWALLRDVLVPLALSDHDEAIANVTRLPGHPMARAALIGALVDLDLRTRSVTMAKALADEPIRQSTPTCAVIGRYDDQNLLVEQVAQALARGNRHVKLKIDPLGGLDAVRAVRARWPELSVALDANGSFEEVQNAATLLQSIERVGEPLAYIEQPLHPHNLVGTAVLARKLDTNIALDESITSIGEATSALSLRACQVINLKPARVGGPLHAKAIAQLAASQGRDVFVGGMYESGIGRGTSLAIAAQPECTLPTDLGPTSQYFERDVTEPVELVDGELAIPLGVGFGLKPDRQAIDALTTASFQMP